MNIVIDLDNPADVRTGLEILRKYLPSAAVDTDTPLPQRLVDNVWLRLGPSNRRLLKGIEDFYPNRCTIEMLAGKLNRPARSVRSSMNGALARAIKNAKDTVPGAPDLLSWHHNGSVYEVGYSRKSRQSWSPSLWMTRTENRRSTLSLPPNNLTTWIVVYSVIALCTTTPAISFHGNARWEDGELRRNRTFNPQIKSRLATSEIAEKIEQFRRDDFAECALTRQIDATQTQPQPMSVAGPNCRCLPNGGWQPNGDNARQRVAWNIAEGRLALPTRVLVAPRASEQSGAPRRWHATRIGRSEAEGRQRSHPWRCGIAVAL